MHTFRVRQRRSVALLDLLATRPKGFGATKLSTMNEIVPFRSQMTSRFTPTSSASSRCFWRSWRPRASLSDAVLVDLDEREQALRTMGGALRRLPVGERGRSIYVSKMIAAAAAGLFDTMRLPCPRQTGGITFPRSTISSIWILVELYGLVGSSDLHCWPAQLDHIRFMRNHASVPRQEFVVDIGPVVRGFRRRSWSRRRVSGRCSSVRSRSECRVRGWSRCRARRGGVGGR